MKHGQRLGGVFFVERRVEKSTQIRSEGREASTWEGASTKRECLGASVEAYFADTRRGPSIH